MWPSAAGKVNCQRLSGFSSFDQWNRHFLLEMPLESPMYYSQKIILEKISISHQNYQILAWVFFFTCDAIYQNRQWQLKYLYFKMDLILTIYYTVYDIVLAINKVICSYHKMQSEHLINMNNV